MPVLTSLLSDNERELALAAQEALGKIGCAAWGRRGAATVLGQVGDPSVMSLVAELLDDDSINVRRAAGRSLGYLHAKEHVHRFARMAEADPARLAGGGAKCIQVNGLKVPGGPSDSARGVPPRPPACASACPGQAPRAWIIPEQADRRKAVKREQAVRRNP